MMQDLILFFGLSYYYHSRLWRDCACQGFGRRPDIHRQLLYIMFAIEQLRSMHRSSVS